MKGLKRTKGLFSLVTGLLVLFILILSACAASPHSDRAEKESLQESAASGAGSANYDDKSGSQSDEVRAERKLVRNAEVESESEDVQKSYETIVKWIRDNGGYEHGMDLSAGSAYQTIRATLKITPDKLDALLEVIGQNTTVINLESSTDDITEEYYDTGLRLKSQKAALEQYYELLKQTENLDDILRLKGIIDNLTEDIEALEGKLKLWDSRVAESTVTLSLYQQNDPEKPKTQVKFSAMSFGDMMRLVGNGFLSVVNVLAAILQWLVIIIGSMLPVGVIALVVILIIRFMMKRRKNKRGGEQ